MAQFINGLVRLDTRSAVYSQHHSTPELKLDKWESMKRMGRVEADTCVEMLKKQQPFNDAVYIVMIITLIYGLLAYLLARYAEWFARLYNRHEKEKKNQKIFEYKWRMRIRLFLILMCLLIIRGLIMKVGSVYQPGDNCMGIMSAMGTTAPVSIFKMVFWGLIVLMVLIGLLYKKYIG